MCMKIKIVIENQGVDRLLVYTENKGLIEAYGDNLLKSGGIKSEGKSHDVYENKGKYKRHFGKSYDVDENKWS